MTLFVKKFSLFPASTNAVQLLIYVVQISKTVKSTCGDLTHLELMLQQLNFDLGFSDLEPYMVHFYVCFFDLFLQIDLVQLFHRELLEFKMTLTFTVTG